MSLKQIGFQRAEIRDRNLSTTLRHSPIEFSEHLLPVDPPEAG